MRYYAYILGGVVPLGVIMRVAGAVQGDVGGVLTGLLLIGVGAAGVSWGRRGDETSGPPGSRP